VLFLLLLLLVFPVCICASSDIWVGRYEASVEYWNIPNNFITEDFIRLYTRYEKNFTIDNMDVLIPESPMGIIFYTAGVPATYFEYRIEYEKDPMHYLSVVHPFHLYHYFNGTNTIFTVRITYLRDDPNWLVFISLKVEEIDLINNVTRTIDAENLMFTQIGKKIQFFMKPEFFERVENDTRYLIFGFRGEFKNMYERHSFEIAFKKFPLAVVDVNDTSLIQALNGWYGFFGVGVEKYLPRGSRLDSVYVNGSMVSYQLAEIYIYDFRVEDWRFNPLMVYEYFVEKRFDRYEGANITSVYYVSTFGRIIPFAISYVTGIGVGYAFHVKRVVGKDTALIIGMIVSFLLTFFFMKDLRFTMLYVFGLIVCLFMSVRVGGGGGK